MKEFFDLLDEEGQLTGETKERSQVHRDGDWHRTIHVWLLHGEDLLLQLRGPEQESNPGLWDISCAGHLSSGEDREQGLKREFDEELGLDLGSRRPEFLGELKSVWSSGSFVDREFNDIYLVIWDGVRPKIDFQKEEVDDVTWIPWAELRNRVMDGDKSLVCHPEEFDLLFERLSGLETCDNSSAP
jgi:isopentenyldiphosphate isomerase